MPIEKKDPAPTITATEAPAEVLQPSAKEPTKTEVKASAVTDDVPLNVRDPFYGQGGAYTINEKGDRVRVPEAE